MRRIDDEALPATEREKLMYIIANSLGDDEAFYAQWCEDHLRGHYGMRAVPTGVMIYFDDPADALYFNLRFF